MFVLKVSVLWGTFGVGVNGGELHSQATITVLASC